MYVNILYIFFSIFGLFLFFATIYYKLYEMILAFDIDKYVNLFEYVSLPKLILKIIVEEYEIFFIIFIVVLFSIFFLVLYSSIKNLFRAELYVVCDKGFAILTFDRKNRFKSKTIFYFKSHYELIKKEKSEFRFTGMRTHYYVYYCFLEKKKKIFTISYSYSDKTELENSRDRIFCENVAESFVRFQYRK